MIELFITFHWFDAVDILLVAFLLYEIYTLVKGTSAINILFGMIILYVVWLIVKALDMQLLGSILSRFIDVGVIAIIIVFQQELRRFLLILGKTEFFNRRSFTKNFLMLHMTAQRQLDLHPILKACRNMSGNKTGAIIIIAQDSDLEFYAQTGEVINSIITDALIESIFYKNNPLHDGAMIIKDNMIHAVRCVLPSTDKADFPTNLGMRHRAAVGLTEKTDAIAIVVSEQTGAVSLAYGGQIEYNMSSERFTQALQERLR